MALTVGQLAYALRITADPGDAVDAGVTAELTRMQAVAVAYIELDVGTRAPETVRDEAVRLFTGYLYDGPDFNPGGAASSYINAWRQSGAQALLARWRQHRAGLLGPAGAAGGGAAPGAGFAGSGLDRAALTALIDERIAAADLPSSGGQGLTVEQLADLRGSVALASIQLSDRDVNFVANDGIARRTIKVPGISVFDEGTRLETDAGASSADQVDEIAFAGADVAAAREGNKVTVTVSGVTAADVQGLVAAHETTQQAEQFEAALRTETDLVSAKSVIIALSNAATMIGGRPKVPPAGEDRELVARVGSGLHHRFDVSTLRAKARVALSQQLDDTNSVSWRDGDDTFRLAMRNVDDELLFSSDTGDTYVLTVQDSQIDLQPEARRSAVPLATTIRAAMQAAVEGDVTLATNGDKLTAALKAGNIDVADLRFDAGTAVAGRYLRINAGATGFEGATIAESPVYGATVVHSGALTGLAITQTNRTLAAVARAFSTSLDLNTDPNGEGEFHYEIDLRIVNPISPMTFEESGQDDATESGLVFASVLAAQPVFVLGGDVEGHKIAEFTVLRASASPKEQGKVRVYLITSGTNKTLGYAADYTPTSGSGTGNLTVSLTMNLTFLPTDPGAASRGGATGVIALTHLQFQFGRGVLDNTHFDIRTPAYTTDIPNENKVVSIALMSDDGVGGPIPFYQDQAGTWKNGIDGRVAYPYVGSADTSSEATFGNSLTLMYGTRSLVLQATGTALNQNTYSTLRFGLNGVRCHMVHL